MRRSTWSGLTVALWTALAFGGLIAFADEPPAAPAETKILNCSVDAQLPPEPAATEEGGYRFEYQSIRGVTADERVCTLYRVRNTAGHAPTPLRWLQGSELLMDKTRLPRCPSDAESCPWISVAKYFEGHVDTNLSVIRYGLNADAFDRQVETFLGTIVLDDARSARSIGTEFEGVFANVDGEAVPVHVIVKSRIEAGVDGQPMAVLEVTDLGGRGDLENGTLRLSWDALQASRPAAAALRAAPAEDVLGIAIAAGPTDEPVEGAHRRAEHAAALARSPGDFSITFAVEEYELVRGLTLRVHYRDESEPLISVEMPAFLPPLERR